MVDAAKGLSGSGLRVLDARPEPALAVDDAAQLALTVQIQFPCAEPFGNAGKPVFSPLLIEWLEEAWLMGVPSWPEGLDRLAAPTLAEATQQLDDLLEDIARASNRSAASNFARALELARPETVRPVGGHRLGQEVAHGGEYGSRQERPDDVARSDLTGYVSGGELFAAIEFVDCARYAAFRYLAGLG